MKRPRIEDWAVRADQNNVYIPPEAQEVCLNGAVYDHPSFPDGTRVFTSPIVNVQGRRVFTRNTEYDLGKVCPKYVEWCEENGIEPPSFSVPIRLRKNG